MSAIGSLGTSNPASSTNAFQAMTSEDFIRVMFSELTNQDPLSPNDSQALLEQISSIRAIESDINLSDRLHEITLQNEISSSGALLGTFVQGLTDGGVEVVGFVDSVSVTREGTVLNLSSGFSVPLKRVTEVVDPDLVRTVPDGPPAPDTPPGPDQPPAPPPAPPPVVPASAGPGSPSAAPAPGGSLGTGAFGTGP